MYSVVKHMKPNLPC